MNGILRSASNIFYLLTIIGGLLAGWIVAMSFGNMGGRGGPDFSAVIAVTLPVIPYCIARALDGIRANDYPTAPRRQASAECPLCGKDIAPNSERCPHCKSRVPGRA